MGDAEMSAVVSRRSRLREELTEEIKACACRQLDAGGPEAVTLRGIARELGVSPAALYTYFDSLDALFDALITEGFDQLADAVSAAVAAQPPEARGERMLAGVHAYRAWAIANPARFRLLYLTPVPVPGYQAPTEGAMLTAELRVFVPLLETLVTSWEQGLLPEPEPGPEVDTTKFREHFGLAITSDQLRVATGCWGAFHGLVALEVNGHIHERWVDPAALFDASMRDQIRRLGFSMRG
jgi:AcrR family transcriptional regulator